MWRVAHAGARLWKPCRFWDADFWETVLASTTQSCIAAPPSNIGSLIGFLIPVQWLFFSDVVFARNWLLIKHDEARILCVCVTNPIFHSLQSLGLEVLEVYIRHHFNPIEHMIHTIEQVFNTYISSFKFPIQSQDLSLSYEMMFAEFLYVCFHQGKRLWLCCAERRCNRAASATAPASQLLDGRSGGASPWRRSKLGKLEAAARWHGWHGQIQKNDGNLGKWKL